ncbi:hypothetical protein [Nevskia sp.]|uniref:hypothetical protein n=1 Tax=Nevskia sp. TaxID=1929292 RepID=UPI0025EF30F7|nr:hypothetical protein [Nevskia sp.]
MKNKQWLGARLALTSIALAAAAMPAQAAFETITDSGTTVLKLCQGTEANRNPTTGVCKVTGNFPTGSTPGTFPGLSGSNWAVYATNNNQAVIANGTTIGNLDDRIWRNGSTTEYVFGFRLQMVNTLWTPPSGTCPSTTPTYFEVNDMFRNGFTGRTGLQIAYRQGSAEEGAWFSGRTNQGLNEYASSPEGLNPARSADWVNFRTDVNIDDPDSLSNANSAWMFVRVVSSTAPSSSAVANAIRLSEGGEEGQCQFSINLNGLKP